MGRRKGNLIPQRVGEAKRQCLSWNMTDFQENNDVLYTDIDNGNASTSISNEISGDTQATEREGCVQITHYCDLSSSPPILCDLRIDNVQTIQMSVGRLGSFSAVHSEQGSSEEFRLTINNQLTHCAVGTVVRFHKTEKLQCDDGDYSNILRINASIEQVNALKYLQTKGFICITILNSDNEQEIYTSANIIEFSVYLNYQALSKVTIPSEDQCLKSKDKMMKILIGWFYDIGNARDEPYGHGNSNGDELELLFSSLKHRKESNYNDIKTGQESQPYKFDHDLKTLQHDSLVPLLRQYQMRSVEWMINREQQNKKTCVKGNGNLHPLWKEITIGVKLGYYSTFTGRITLDKQCHQGYPSGGILADEMGLGKTVEVLACILNHPMKEQIATTNSCDEPITDAVKDVLEKRLLDSKLLNAGTHNDDETLNVNCFTSNSHEPLYDALSEPGEVKACENDDLMEMDKEVFSYRCICGKIVAAQEDALKCRSCGLYQHAACVGIKQNFKEVYICPDCTVKGPIIESRATLIISPLTIAHQWLDEIHRHILPGSLDVFIYEGVSKQGFVYPTVLADNDVILTTYEALRKDFHYLTANQGGKDRSSRYHKRYASWSCPLTCIKFWRICLDEAQMVEGTTAKAAETALNLLAVHRWCVTGTPIQRGIEDLYGLLLFLGVEPYYRRTWWKKLLYEPFQKGNFDPLLNVLQHVLWRTAKKDVINEINLPEQQESLKWLYFSPVEDYFYRRQHEECSSSAFKEMNKIHESIASLNSLDKNSLQKVMGPLLRLRQACCHPQAVRGCFLTFQKSTITMEQLLETLVVKAKNECEEAHRLLLCAMNGLAGTYVLQESWPQAVDTYREAMRSWREHEDLIKTDSLQKLHTLHNLNEVLKREINGCSHTLRDDFLSKEADKLSEKYLEKWRNQVTVAECDVTVAHKTLCGHKQKVDFKCPWWSVFLDEIKISENKNMLERNVSEKLLSKVKDDLLSLNNMGESLNMANSFSDLHGLEFLLCTRLDTIEQSHDNLMIELRKLSAKPSKEMITSTAECCLRPIASNKAKRCDYCKVDEIFGMYESLLFGHQGVNNIDHDSQQTAGGLRGETEVERSLKSIYNFMRNQTKHGEKRVELQRQAQAYFEYLDMMKRNFKVYRHFWFALRELVSAHDELEMCTTRLRLRFPGEKLEENQIHIISPSELGAAQMRFRSDNVIANSTLRKSLGQLLYLKNLAKNEIKDGGENMEPCPVCTKSLGVQWNVFSCGHCVCCQCLWVLLNQPRVGGRPSAQVKCPMCRSVTATQDISYVSTVVKQCEDEKNVVVKGSHSTKIEAIVRTLLGIQNLDPSAKTIVFSTWQDVLEHISHALTENDVEYRRIKGRKDFQESLEEFKVDDHIPVLLLPLQSGSNGLNIIEATHVILVEPSLNPSLERQAVGRIHRIGQTKPTFVHRFLTRKTVEEKIANVLQTKTVSAIRCGTRRTDKDVIPLTLGELASFFEMPAETPMR